MGGAEQGVGEPDRGNIQYFFLRMEKVWNRFPFSHLAFLSLIPPPILSIPEPASRQSCAGARARRSHERRVGDRDGSLPVRIEIGTRKDSRPARKAMFSEDSAFTHERIILIGWKRRVWWWQKSVFTAIKREHRVRESMLFREKTSYGNGTDAKYFLPSLLSWAFLAIRTRDDMRPLFSRPFYQYLGHVSSNSKSVCLFH